MCAAQSLNDYRWLTSTVAVDPNSHWALENRDLIWQRMTPEERAEMEKSRQDRRNADS
jgi:hypothetical protein